MVSLDDRVVNVDDLLKVEGLDGPNVSHSVYTRTVERAYRTIVELLPDEHAAVFDLGGVVTISYSFARGTYGELKRKAKAQGVSSHSLNVRFTEPAIIRAVVPRSGLDVVPIGEINHAATMRYTWSACLRGVGLKASANKLVQQALGLQNPNMGWSRNCIEKWW